MKSQVFIDQLSDTIFDAGSDAFEVVVCCRPSPSHRERNEDAAGVWQFPDGSIVLAVADGMGGTPAGDLASRLAIERLDATFRAMDQEIPMRSPILDAFESANQDVLDKAAGSGTTLVAVEILGATIRTYNVGDSGALLVGQRGRVKIETTDHSPVGYGVAAGLIDSEKAMDHRDRHYLSNHVGSKEMHIDLGIPRDCAPLDTLLLASDGLFDNLTPGKIVDTIRCGSLERGMAELTHAATEKMLAAIEGEETGKPDDLTIVLARRRRAR